MAMEFTDLNFEKEVLNSDVPVLVDFWATWCGPCVQQGPIIDALSKELEGKQVKVGKLNVDENPQTAQNFDVLSIPTLIIFKNGEVIETMVGVTSQDVLKQKLGF